MCHTQAFGPSLTSYGREFKLRGYVDGGGSHPLIAPLSAMVRASYTHLGSGVAAGSEEPGYGARDNFAHDESSIFLAGRLLPRVGIFSQVTYNGIADTVALDNTDIRFANGTRLGGQAIEYGVSVNNAPTVQDVWNTTPVWGYPYASSPLAPTPGAAALIDGGLDGQVAGATAYALVGGVLYVEGGAYRSFSKDAQKALGTFAVDENELRGTAPYWRLTLQNTDAGWNGHYLALGTFGMHADIRPGRVRGVGTDTITDLGVDLNYQYLANLRHIFEAKATYIYEDAKLGASFNPLLGSALNEIGRAHV